MVEGVTIKGGRLTSPDPRYKTGMDRGLLLGLGNETALTLMELALRAVPGLLAATVSDVPFERTVNHGAVEVALATKFAPLVMPTATCWKPLLVGSKPRIAGSVNRTGVGLTTNLIGIETLPCEVFTVMELVYVPGPRAPGLTATGTKVGP